MTVLEEDRMTPNNEETAVTGMTVDVEATAGDEIGALEQFIFPVIEQAICLD